MRRRRGLAGDRIWVVGASSGIGAALAGELDRRGARVAISARNADRLTEVAARGSSTIACAPMDVTSRAAVHEAVETVVETIGGLDTVVWSAGFWRQFDAATWDAETFARHVEVNLLGLNNLLAEVVPRLVSAGRGRIAVVASVAGFRGVPGSEAYGATKAAQIHLLEAMRASLKPTGVAVTTVNPGFVRTPMTEGNSFPMPFIIEAHDAATAIADGLEHGRDEVTFPLPAAVVMKLARYVPGPVWTRLTARRS